MARRTGVPTLIGVAARMCDLITRFTPTIAQVYPGNSALQAALAAANSACAVLHQELAQVREYGD